MRVSPKAAEARRMGKKDPRAPVSPEHVRIVREVLPELAELLDVSIVIVDAGGHCLADSRGCSLLEENLEPCADAGSGRDSECGERGGCPGAAIQSIPFALGGTIPVELRLASDSPGVDMADKAVKAASFLNRVLLAASAQAPVLAPSLPEGPTDVIFPNLVGESQAMRRLKNFIIKAAKTDATVLLQGESGTGKELVARAIHRHSGRGNGPFVAINCGAIPESLMESMLFGYEPGAFTGAGSTPSVGLLEQSNKGAFFMDEISEMPASLQVKLLRVLQEKRIRRVGGKIPKDLDIRIIAATNTDLHALVRNGKFREDLFYRIDVIPITVPPLRERHGDVRLLVAHFLREFGNGCCTITEDVMRRFEAYPWTGNVRELRNFVEYGVSLCDGGVITRDLMEPRFARYEALRLEKQGDRAEYRRAPARREKKTARPPEAAGLDAGTIPALLEVYGHDTEGKRSVAAHLGISLATLYRKLALLRAGENNEAHRRGAP